MATSNKPTIDPSSIPPLPSDILDDLVDAFHFYDKEDQGIITAQQFKNILHNFGFHRLSKKDMDEELRRHDIDLTKRASFDFDTTKNVVGYRWMKGGGKEDEARDCFKLFDRRDKGYINVNDIKNVIGNYLEFPVTDTEIQEMIDVCDPNGLGQINLKDFIKFYNS